MSVINSASTVLPSSSISSPVDVHIELPAVLPGDRRCRVELPCVPESAGFARKLVTTSLAAWSLDHLTDVAELLVTELVANAAKHTGCTRISVSVKRQQASVRVGVRDSSVELPCRMEPKGEAESGYGLGLVDSLASGWGVDLAALGKWVWFELRTAAT
ncbi:ATP-binding protein [Kitasatospora sp. NPDC097605]|uniref:ATP-binding protein n=1 Tax=Kitasatospora sp. NPDC097605 TaxID=3157226 RepID=UPI00333458A1